MLLMALIVLAGASGWLGVRAATAHSAGFGYDMTLVYPRIARPGLDVPWNLRLTHPGGFKGQITVAISANYFDIFEYQDFHPESSGETSDAKFVYLTFTPPKGDVFTLSFDTYVQPASQIGRDAETKVIIGGVTVADAHYSTWLVP